jgi:hypothetical protein
LCRCGNTDQMAQLKAALRLRREWSCQKKKETAGLKGEANAQQRYSASR